MMSIADLVEFYQDHKDIAGPALGSLVGPIGLGLVCLGRKSVSAGCWLTRWARGTLPLPPMEEAVSLLITRIATATVVAVDGRPGVLKINDRTYVLGDEIHVVPEGKPANWGNSVSSHDAYNAHECRAIKAAYDARMAAIREGQRVALREAAAVGN